MNHTTNLPIQIIAEAAQGYEGDGTLAKLLVRAAVGGGADLVKFQLVYANELATSSYKYFQLFQQLEMAPAEWKAVAAEAAENRIGLMFDVFGTRSLREALELGARAVKIHTSDFFNDSLVAEALEKAPAVYFSAGGIEFEEISTFLDRHSVHGNKKLTMLVGFQAEPTPISANNIARLGEIRKRFPALPLGFMDHSSGGSDEASWLGVLALPYGITAIEKHITLERSLQLEDSVSALNANEFREYVQRVRAAEAALGSGGLILSDEERTYSRRALKTAVTAAAIKAGQSITPDSVVMLRSELDPQQVPIFRIEQVVHKRARRDLPRFTPIYESDLL